MFHQKSQAEKSGKNFNGRELDTIMDGPPKEEKQPV